MGFPCLCYRVILPKPIILIFQLLDLLRYAISFFFFRIGFTNSVEYYPVAWLPSIADSVTVPQSSSIKSRLPAVELSNLWLEKCKDDQSLACAVCLEQFNARDEFRELNNCSHLFHRECIDKWVDLGKITCPLCRALLLPEEHEGIERERSWFDSVRCRISYWMS